MLIFFTSTCNVDDVDYKVRQFSAEVCRQIVTAGLKEDQFGMEFRRQLFDRFQIQRVVLKHIEL